MRRFSRFLARLACGVGLCGGVPSVALAASTHAIYTFTGGADGAVPYATLTPDGFGNFYGTTQAAGFAPFPQGYGTIFKLDAGGALTTLYDFQGGVSGEYPESGVSLIGGRLYGNAPGGPVGATSLLFSIETDGSNFTVLHAMNAAEGTQLIGLLQPAPGGGVFGLGQSGGRYGHGTLFYLNAKNTFTVVHEFAGGSDGQAPTYLIKDAAGNLYGSTSVGGICSAAKHGCGTIFKYATATRTYSILYTFEAGADGASPLVGAVTANGTLYGVSTEGGADHHGALFALTPASGGAYDFSVLTPIISRYPTDHARNPPALSPDGALIGQTTYAGDYVCQNGAYSIYFSLDTVSYGQFLVPKSQPGTFLGTSISFGDVSGVCAQPTGCGTIYYGTK